MRLFFVHVFCIMLLMIFTPVSAQPYLLENQTWQQDLVASEFNSLALGDVDNDGDLDLDSMGCTFYGGFGCTSYITKIYINNGTALVENSTWEQNLTPINYGSVVWGDMDNDGDLDLVASGCNDGGGTSQSCNDGGYQIFTYINNGTALVENSTWEQNLIKNWKGSNALGDIDNDGDLDLVVTGQSSTGKIAKIYINNGTTLLENSTWQQDLNGVYESGIALGDIDNDGDLDLVVTGDEGISDEVAKIYINNGTTLLENSTWGQNLLIVDWSSVTLGDIDNDGDLDLVLIGHNTDDNHRVYVNTGTTFQEIQKDVGDGGDLGAGVFEGSLFFGDYNNDGLLDLAVTGNEGYTYIYKNNGTAFSDANENNLINLEKGSVAVFVDIDNDSDLDVIATGFQEESVNENRAKIYINNITTQNNQPDPPVSNFICDYSEGDIILSWGNGSDMETNTPGLYYNLRVGACSECHNIVSGIFGSGDDNGYFGNMMQRKSITLNRQFGPGTTIYWAVQTIDTGLAKSAWSVEQNYIIPSGSAPVLSNVGNGTVMWDSAIITFDTDTQGNATVHYGVDETDLNMTASNSTFALNHSLSIVDLAENTTYHYNVTSCGIGGNCSISGTYNFTTGVCNPDWSCSSWGACQSGNTQACNQWADANSCGKSYSGSNTRSCTYSPGSGGTGPSYTPPATSESYTFDSIEPGSPITKEITTGITITIEVKNALSNVDLVVSSMNEKPKEVVMAPEGRVYTYLQINSSNIADDAIKEAFIEFRVSKDWIDENNINTSTIALHRYHEDGWEGLETDLPPNESVLWFHYRAKTPGFSYFAISGEEIKETVMDDNQTQPQLLCDPGSERCHGDELQECSPAGTVWTVKELCAYGCDSTVLACIPLPAGDTIWYYIAISVMVMAMAAAVYLIKKKSKKA